MTWAPSADSFTNFCGRLKPALRFETPRAKNKARVRTPALHVFVVIDLPHFDLIADLHCAPRLHDASRRGAAFCRENADLAENLARLSGDRTVAIDDEEITGLDLIVAAEVDLHEIAFTEGKVPIE